MKIGIVGTNFVSDMFMEACKSVPSIEVTGVTSGKRDNAQAFADKYNIKNVYNDYLQMMDSGDIEAIYLAVPNALHKPMSIECLKHHIPTICEKPFATNVDEVKEVFDQARLNNTYIHDAIVPLYTPNFKILKDSLPLVGRIRKVVFDMSKYSSRYDAYLRGENPTTFRRELSNGAMMDLGIYVLSDAIALFGMPLDCYANGVMLDSGVDGAGTIILKYADFEVDLLYSKITDTKIISQIEGEEGIIQIEQPSLMDNIYLIRSKDHPQYAKGEKIKISIDQGNAFSHQLIDFVESNKEGRSESSKVSHQLSIDIHTILTKCRYQMNLYYPADERE